MLLACDQAIDSDPANPEHWIQKSQRLGELQRYDEAMICQDEAMKLFRTNRYEGSCKNGFEAKKSGG